MRLWRRRPPRRQRVTRSHPSWSHCAISVAEFQLGRILSPSDSKWYSGWFFFVEIGTCVPVALLSTHASQGGLPIVIKSCFTKHLLQDNIRSQTCKLCSIWRFDFWTQEKPPTLLACPSPWYVCGLWWESGCIVHMHQVHTTSCGGVERLIPALFCWAAIGLVQTHAAYLVEFA